MKKRSGKTHAAGMMSKTTAYSSMSKGPGPVAGAGQVGHLSGPGPGNSKSVKGMMPMEAYPSRQTPSGAAPKGMRIQREGE